MTLSILVTGATSGFGRLTVETLARRGYNVFAGIRESEGRNAGATGELRALAEKDSLALHVVDLDVTSDASVNKAIESVVRSAGTLDVVVNNAGISYSGPIESFTLDQVQQQFDTNVFGVIRVNRAALPYMRSQGSGLLIQIGSVAGRVAFPFVGLYGATKFALEGLTESYRYELAALGIDAVIIEPGTYPTSLASNGLRPADRSRVAPYAPIMQEFVPRFLSDIRAEPAPDPQDVADAVATLAALPAGKRPLRTVVAVANQRQHTEQVNAASEQATREYMKMLGIVPHITLSAQEASQG